jgi:choline-sulfatase
MLRRGAHKLVVTPGLPPMLFDLARDPLELDDLAGRADTADLQATLMERLLADWDPAAVDARVRASQKRRLFLRRLGMEQNAFPNWSYEARPGDHARFVRPSTAGGPVGPKPRSRFPYVTPTPPDPKTP